VKETEFLECLIGVAWRSHTLTEIVIGGMVIACVIDVGEVIDGKE